MSVPDYWGDIVTPAVRTPVAVLREQAALLARKTQGLIEARVETTSQLGKFLHSLCLVVPSLDEYRFELLRIRHDLDLYPVFADGPGGGKLDDEEAFTDWLQRELSSQRTKRVVGSLLAQVGVDAAS